MNIKIDAADTMSSCNHSTQNLMILNGISQLLHEITHSILIVLISLKNYINKSVNQLVKKKNKN